MSIRYRDRNGAETVVSGMTPGGNLETGAVATRTGTIPVPALTPEQQSAEIAVTFSEAMPDADYLVLVNNVSTRTICVIQKKTANGFSAWVKNVSASDEVAYNISYTAFKLYEVADAEQLYSTVQDIESMVPSNASSTNKFATINDLTGETRSLDRRIDDLEDYMPSNVSISNKVATQADLANVSIDELGDIEDVDLNDLAEGQTLVWDSTNSKWVNGQGGKVYSAGDGITISNTDEISAKVDDTSITTDTNDALKVADTYKTIFVGTRAQWDALSTADKVKYNEAHITDDVIGGEVADEVTDGLMSPVTSNAVYDYPIDSIADGQHRPPTSNAVYDALSNKQDKLTDPLTKSDVVNNLSTPTTNVPLSAAQGKVINDKLTDFMSSGTYYVGVRNTTNAITGGVGSNGHAFVLGGNPSDTKHINMYYNGSDLYFDGKWNGTSVTYKITDPVRSYNITLSSKISFIAGTPMRTDKEFFFGFVIQVKSGQTIAANETLFTLPENTKGWFCVANTGSSQIVVNQAKVYSESAINSGTYISIYGSCPILK